MASNRRTIEDQFLTTAILIQNENEKLYRLFKVAYQFAFQGQRSVIITKSFHEENLAKLIEEHLNFSPNILDLIKFRHFDSAVNLIKWCQTYHASRNSPFVILINGLEDFCDAGDFCSYFICASLIDVLPYLIKSKSNCSDVHHLIVAFKASSFDSRPALFDLFRNVVNADEVMDVLDFAHEYR